MCKFSKVSKWPGYYHCCQEHQCQLISIIFVYSCHSPGAEPPSVQCPWLGRMGIQSAKHCTRTTPDTVPELYKTLYQDYTRHCNIGTPDKVSSLVLFRAICSNIYGHTDFMVHAKCTIFWLNRGVNVYYNLYVAYLNFLLNLPIWADSVIVAKSVCGSLCAIG